jgi:beta-glucosidase
MDLPPGVDDMISAVLAANPNTILVTQSGTPFSMPWHASASSIIHAWYGGNEVGHGIADVLFGDVNPSARLPLSWPEKLEDNPTFLNFGSVQGRVLYGEDVYVGYKYYDALGRKALFPFGHGLSYTDFSLETITTTREKVLINVKNTGMRSGSVVVQAYVSAVTSQIQRPKRELHGFEKVELDFDEEKLVVVEIDPYAGSLWDESENKWLLEEGEYQVWLAQGDEEFVDGGKFMVKESCHWLGLQSPKSSTRVSRGVPQHVEPRKSR